MTCLKIAKNSTNYLGYFCSKICHKDLSKIAQFCHTVARTYIRVCQLKFKSNLNHSHLGSSSSKFLLFSINLLSLSIILFSPLSFFIIYLSVFDKEPTLEQLQQSWSIQNYFYMINFCHHASIMLHSVANLVKLYNQN